ncbi:hypothetical protein ACHHYP_04718 [Achlya hypogyna]|uniref:protein O-GlcNAc transferase n=1 Tax=Achlya hypogyna TaxID=1202772 RepID=A0A1V9Z092_ACHHY|nr:hypothetical protein ACHHYP_04718 [Achlya hypogyna]
MIGASGFRSFASSYAYALLLRNHFPDTDPMPAFEVAVALAQPPLHKAHIDAINSLGLLQSAHGAHAAAVATYEAALAAINETTLEHLPLLVNLQATHVALGHFTAALPLAREATRLAPSEPVTHHNLGSIYYQLRQFDVAQVHFEEAVRVEPRWHHSYLGLGLVFAEYGNASASVEAYAAALAVVESTEVADTVRLQLATAELPRIPDSGDHVVASRMRYATQLAALQARPLQLQPNPVDSIGSGSMGYYLIYQGGIDRPLREALANIYRCSMPGLSYVAPHVLAHRAHTDVYRAEGRRMRVGVLSAYFRDHTVGVLLQRVLAQLDKAKIELYLLRFPTATTNLTTRLVANVEHDIELPFSVVHAQQTIGALALDVIVFSEIGMNPESYFLAFAQLALRSVAFWGHAVTSGITTVDYAITSPLFQAHQEHYTECLYAMPGLTTAFQKPRVVEDPTDAVVQALAALNQTIYFVPQTLYKLHPAFDALVRAILEQHVDSVLVFLLGSMPHLADQVQMRWRRVLPASLVARMYFLPFLPPAQFLRVCAAADVVLDTFPVGGGRTSLEIFAVGTPIIVHESRTTILQLSAAMYELMGISDLIAYSDADYVAKAVQVGRNASYRADLSRRIMANHHVLYDQSTAADDWTSMLKTVLALPPPTTKCPAIATDDPIVFGIYIFVEPLQKTFAFRVRASQVANTTAVADAFGTAHNLEPLYVAFIDSVLYRGVARLKQPIVATVTFPSPVLPSDTIVVDVRFGDDVALVAHHCLWKHRVPSSPAAVQHVLDRLRAGVGKRDASAAWRAARERFPLQRPYARRAVTDKCVTLVITTCKRLELFLATMASMAPLRRSSAVCSTIVIDDHSSSADRRAMEAAYPDAHFLYTTVKGHAHSLNTLLHIVSTRFVLYVEDDWRFVAAKRNVIDDALAVFNDTWARPDVRLVQVLLNEQGCGWSLTTGGGVPYRLREFAVVDHACSAWPGFSLNPGVWDLDLLKAQRLSFDMASDIFERAFSLQVLHAGLHVATLATTAAEHIGAPPGSNQSAYVLNGMPRRFDVR